MKQFKWQKKSTSKNNGNEPDIDMYWSQLKQNTYSNKLNSLKNWLNKQDQPQSHRSTANQNIGRYQNMLNLVKIKRLSLVYSLVASVLLIVACNVPMEYTETVGHVLNWTVSGDADHAQDIAREMDWLYGKDVGYEVKIENGNVSTTISVVLPAEEEHVFNEIISSIESHPDLVRYNLAAVDETSSLPAYKMALRNIFHLSIDVTDLSEEAIALQIQQQLEQYGAEVSHIDIAINDDGTMEFGFEFSTSGDGMEEQIDIQMVLDGTPNDNIELNIGGEMEGGDGTMIIEEIVDGPNGRNVQMFKIDAAEMENMTPEQKQEYVKNKMREAGIEAPDGEIQLNQEGGKQRIKVKREAR